MPADSEKTKAQLLDKVQKLRGRVDKLESTLAKHRQTGHALRESEEQSRRAITHAPVPIMIHAVEPSADKAPQEEDWKAQGTVLELT